MKIKVSDYIVKFIKKNNINTLFTITGGFSMHLNDSFGNESFNTYYQHHEQACGYSALGYGKTTNKPSVVCTTSGVAATNAISPCLVAYQDSVSILFISGQVKSLESTRQMNNDQIKLRNYAFSNSDIITNVSNITKYSCEITDVSLLKDILSQTIYHLINGRPGPVWLSVPIDIQGTLIDDIDIPIIEKEKIVNDINNNVFNDINKLLIESKRPIILAGNGIRLGNCYEKFRHFINKYNIPIVTSVLGIDLIESDNNLYCGRVGIYGDRSGNFCIQNSDVIIVLGSSLNQAIVSYKPEWFAREAKIIYIDNDSNELKKTNVNYTLKINMDLNTFFDNYNFDPINYSEWNITCNYWKNKWSFVLPSNLLDTQVINPYHALNVFFDKSPENKLVISTTGSIVFILWHMIRIKKNDRYLYNGQADMGPELPAAIGAQISDPNKMVIAILGEGSLQLNIQELQTIVHHKLPIKILVFNNGSYGAIIITQNNYFKNNYGVNKDTGLSFPDTQKIANAYGIKYICSNTNEELDSKYSEFLSCNETIIMEVFCCVQRRQPIFSSVKNNDGTFTNRPLEDMEPFMDREEFKNEMIVKLV
jgi:acetolactate synthase-1/2/3 large subunit